MIARDLDKIVGHWGGRVPEGKRNTFLHLIGTCLTHTGRVVEIEKEGFRIAAIPTPDLSGREVVGMIKSAESQAQKASSSHARPRSTTSLFRRKGRRTDLG